MLSALKVVSLICLRISLLVRAITSREEHTMNDREVLSMVRATNNLKEMAIHVKYPLRGFYVGCPTLASSRPVFVAVPPSGL